MTEEPTPQRRPYRPPIGIPTTGEPTKQAAIASLAFHVLIVLLLLAPTIFVSKQLYDIAQRGAGGPGPAGGGGGGFDSYPGRLKWVPERVNFLKVAPEAAVQKTEPEKPKPPEIKPPTPPPPEPEPVTTTVKDSAAVAAAIGDTAGKAATAGAGTGKDGTSGDGPGRGGGVGSGIGTGRGSGVGPGTGGGDGSIYPPTVVALPILPLPVPAKVRPYRMVAQFEVDTAGNARLIGFNPSRDAGYNRRIREMLLEIRFRPAVTMDGRPVKAIAVVKAEAM